jgi:RNA polymerase sigma-70 factor (ECF subfamily)
MSAFGKAKITRVAADTEVDWASAYQELLPRVYHYFCLRTGDRLEAEDLTATTFERAWRDRERYRKDLGAFTNWLFGIAQHVLIAHYRQNHRELLVADETNTEKHPRPLEEDSSRREEFERLVAMLQFLPEREREVFSLKYGAQFTNRSIAKITGLTESNVGTILHRIVARLRVELENENER